MPKIAPPAPPAPPVPPAPPAQDCFPMLFTSLIKPNGLEQAIIYHPLIVSPDILVSEAIALMSNARATCRLPEQPKDTNYLLTDAHTSCVLVIKETKLVGIFTKRDVVHLSSEGRQIGSLKISEIMTYPVISMRQSELPDIFTALNLLQRHRIRHLPILDDHDHLVGLLTHENLRQVLRPIHLLRLRLVSEVMNIRVIHAFPETPVIDITRLMTREKVSSVVIVEEKTQDTDESSQLFPIGMITERDIVQFQALNLDLESISIQTVMSSPVFSISPDKSLWMVIKLMEEKRIHRIVVIGERGELKGIVTYTTLLQAMNPLDIYQVVQILEQKVSQLEVENLELLQSRNAKLEQEVKKQIRELESQTKREQLLSAIASRIRRHLNLQDTLDTITTEVRQFLDCDRVFIYQFQADSTGIVRSEDVKTGWLSFQGQLIFDTCFSADLVTSYINGKIRVVNDIYAIQLTPCHREFLENLQVRAKILVPIILDEQIWGFILACQNDAPRIWQKEETELLTQLSIHVAIAIEQAELYHLVQLELQERKRSEKQLRTIVETSASGLVTVDSQGNILFTNPAAAKMFGRNPEELSGWPLGIPGNYDQESRLQEIELIQPSGNRCIINMETAAINWAGQDAVLISLSDITELKRTGELLRQSEAKYRLLVDNLPLGLVVHATDASILNYNPKAAQMLGLIAPKTHGKPMLNPAWRFYREDESPMLAAEYPANQVMTSGKPLKNYVMGLDQPGNYSRIWLLVNAFPIFDRHGQLQQVIETFVDISEQQAALRERQRVEVSLRNSQESFRQLNEELENRVAQRTIALRESIIEQERVSEQLKYSEERFRSFVENANDTIWSLDIQGNFAYISPNLTNLMGYEVSEMLNTAFASYIHPDDLPFCLQALSGVFHSGDHYTSLEYRARHKDGRWRWHISNLSVVRNDQSAEIQVIGITRDDTERKQIEAELRRTNAELARATRLKDEFLASMSHELRTPLNAILGMSEGLEEGVFGTVNQRQKQAIATIERGGKHLLELINDILDLAKVETGKLDLLLTPITVKYLCESSVTFVKQQAIQKNIHITVEVSSELPDIVVDERRIRQVLINLLNNAVKFTHQGGSIKLIAMQEVNSIGDYGSIRDFTENKLPIIPWLCFSVIDTGIGIAESDLDKLFQPFMQIDSSLNRQHNGTGLGLALVRQLVELHGGRVAVTSKVGEGSCFTVRLPYRESHHPTLESQDSASSAFGLSTLPTPMGMMAPQDISSLAKESALILLAEDNQANITTISNYLIAKGYRLIIAKNGQEALQKAKTEHPDLILMDIQMPGIDGLEATRLIRMEEQFVRTPIIALTGLAMPGDREKCIEAGATEYFTKPIKLKLLVEKIQSLLKTT